MTTQIPSQVYPFATQDGKPVPLDIIRPAGLIKIDFINSAVANFILPDTYTEGIILATSACLVRQGSTIPSIVNGTFYQDMFLVYTDTLITVSLLPGTIYVKGLTDSGTLYLQLIERWAGLGLPKQYIRK